MNVKVLLLGPNGQVGWELRRALAPLGELTALDRATADGLTGDLERLDGLARTVRTIRPDVIVNAGAYTAVDKAESEPDAAGLVNAQAPAVLAREAEQCGAWLVHYSTDYVFDGRGDKPWKETDGTGPLNVYGASKLEGEAAIRASGCLHFIFRTSWVYAARGTNFIHTMLRLAAERERLEVIGDQFGAPTGAELIADVTAHAIVRALDDPGRAGTYHLAAAGETTWHGYARYLLDRARKMGWPLKVDDASIDAVASERFHRPAKRPHNSRLDCSSIKQRFGFTLPDWRIGVGRVLNELSPSSQEHHTL